MEIKFDVDGLGISCQNPDQIVINDSTNYVEAVFSFNGEPWDKITNKTAIFHQRKSKAYSVILGEDDRCYIPFEALKNCSFEVGIKASYAEGDVVKTIYTQRCKIKTSISCYSKGFDNPELTPSQYDQIMALIDGGGGGDGAIEAIKVNGESLIITDKSVDISIPTKTSDLVNDTNFVNLAMLNESQSYKVDKVEGKGLSSNDYTDEDKEKISSIDKKQDKLINGENIKTLNGETLLGEGNIKLSVAYSGDTEPADENEQIWIDTSEDFGEFDEYKFDETPTLGSNKPVTSDGIKRALPTKTSDLVNDSNFVNLAMLNESQSYKVDKVEGKGLSTNDFTNEDKAKLLSLENYDDTEVHQSIENKLDKFAESPHLQDLIVIANSDGTVSTSIYTLDDVKNFTPKVKDGTDYNIPCFVNGGCLVDSGKSILTFAQKTNVFTTDNFICFDNNGNLSDSGHKVSDFLTEHQDISGKEDTSNKVTSISSTSTDTEYPSAKCVYDLIGDLETLLGGI